MAHAEKLAEEVKVLTARIHDLESALSSRDGASHPLLQGRDSQRDEIDALYEKGLNEVSDAIGSLSIGSDGQAKYYGETAGSEVWSYPILVCILTFIWRIVLWKPPARQLTAFYLRYTPLN